MARRHNKAQKCHLLQKSAYEDGIHLDFDKNKFYVKAPGQSAQTGTVQQLFSFTGDGDGMYMNSNGILVQSIAGTPRLEYSSEGNFLGMLCEDSRTNLCLHSSDFTNAVWVNVNTTDAANSDTAPDGTVTADTITASSNAGYITQSWQALTSNLVRTFSVWLKRKTGTGDVTLEIGKNSSAALALSSSVWNRFSLTDTVLAGTYTVVSNVVVVTATAHGFVTGDAVRVDYTSGTATDISVASVEVLTADTFTYAQTTGDTTGNCNVYGNLGRIKLATSGDEIFAWGAQGETSNTAGISSNIPTGAAAVVRSADSLTRTFGSEYKITAGTVFAQYSMKPSAIGNLFFILGVNGRHIYHGSSTTPAMFDGTSVVSTANALTAGVIGKVASSFDNNGMALITNGGAIAVGAFDGTWGGGETTIQISGAEPICGHLRKLDYWPSRMTNGQLKQLTG